MTTPNTTTQTEAATPRTTYGVPFSPFNYAGMPHNDALKQAPASWRSRSTASAM